MRGPGGRNWQGAVDAAMLITGDPTPPAAIELLWQADEAVYAAITQPYAQCGHAFDGAGAGASMTTHRLGCQVAPAGLSARAWLSAWGTLGVGAQQAAVTIHTTFSGGVPAGAPDVITVSSQQQGAVAYGDMTGSAAEAAHWLTSDLLDVAPVSAINRRLELAGSLSPTTEEIQVGSCAGFGLAVVGRLADLE